MSTDEKIHAKFDPAIVAENVLSHIDTMYPAMWRAVGSSARLSIKNTIIREIESEMRIARELG